jgi:hypothetical protein
MRAVLCRAMLGPQAVEELPDLGARVGEAVGGALQHVVASATRLVREDLAVGLAGERWWVGRGGERSGWQVSGGG